MGSKARPIRLRVEPVVSHLCQEKFSALPIGYKFARSGLSTQRIQTGELMSQFVQVQSAGLADGHPKMTTIELVLFLTFRLPPRKVGRTGDLRGDATLDIRFQGPPPVYEVKFRVMGRLTKNARSYYPHCVTYTAKPIHEKLLALTRKELTAIGDKIATVIKAEVGCHCKPITADQFDPNVSDLW